MVNYTVSPGVLLDLVPPGTQVSLFEGKCFVTLSGFVFSDISVLGVRIPFHRHVPEVNLRFYVESSMDREERKKDFKKGVVFIKELASKMFLKTMANLYYQQNYNLKHINYEYTEYRSAATLKYSWGRLRKNGFMVRLGRVPAVPVKSGSEMDYIFHNFFGYTNKPDKPTLRYEVAHPLWTSLNVMDFKVKVNFEKSFGRQFGFLNKQKPHSVFVTDGSAITIHRPARVPMSRIQKAA